jgi:hypothetical protein
MIEIILLLIKALFGGAKLPEKEVVESVEEVLKNTSDPIPPTPPAPAPVDESWGSASAIVAAMLRNGYRVFDGPRDLNLNIVAVRKTGAKVDEYGCKIHVFWRFEGKVTHLSWAATTYPGSHYLITKLLNSAGAAILAPGQWPVYKLDIHNGKYKALCQRRGPVRVYRDGDRDREFDLDPDSIQEGMFGINVHAPITPSSGLKTYLSNLVGAASAGCQVFQRLEDFLEFRSICEQSERLWGNMFTLTLLLDSDVRAEDRPPLKDVPANPVKFDTLEEDWVPSAETTGTRNKNLLNVKDADGPKLTGKDWMYMTGSDSRGHAIFPTYAKGLRAGIVNLRSYRTRYGLQSISEILSRWAPSSDTIGSLPGAPKNSPLDYSRFVATRVGIPHNVPLRVFDADGNVTDADRLYRLVSAMVEYENKVGVVPPRAIFNEALRLL